LLLDTASEKDGACFLARTSIKSSATFLCEESRRVIKILPISKLKRRSDAINSALGLATIKRDINSHYPLKMVCKSVVFVAWARVIKTEVVLFGGELTKQS